MGDHRKAGTVDDKANSPFGIKATRSKVTSGTTIVGTATGFIVALKQ